MLKRKSFPCTLFEKYPRNTVFFAVETENVTGIMTKISSILTDAGMSILNGFHTLREGGRKWCWVFAVDPSSSQKTVEEVVESIRGLDEVLEVSYGSEVVAGMTMPPFSIDLRMIESRAFVLDEHSIRLFLKSLWDRWGSAGAVFLYHTGRWAGKTMVKAWSRRFCVTGFEDILSFTVAMYKLSGLIKDYELKVDAEEAMVRLYEYYECYCLRDLGKPSGYLMKGILAGMVEECMGVEAMVVECMCIAAGDLYCEFRVKFSLD